MKGVVTIWLAAMVMGSAVGAYAAIPNDGGRTWKTNPEAYRIGFAAGGADMLARLDAEFRSLSLDLEQQGLRHKLECLNRITRLQALRGAVEDRILQDRLPVPHGPADVPATASTVSYVLGYYCDRAVTVSTGIPENQRAYYTADKLRVTAGGIRAYVAHDQYRAADNAFRDGYVEGAANTLRHVARRLDERPADQVRQKVQMAPGCVQSRYNHLDALHRRLDAEVDKDAASGHNYTIASTLYVLLVECLAATIPTRGTGSFSFTLIDVPGAADTYANGMNDGGQAVGTFTGGDGRKHSFLRTAGGRFATIDVPGATRTNAERINGAGQIAGFYIAGGKTHGFLRRETGAFALVDVPGATRTQVNGLTDAGQMVGRFYTPDGRAHGYVRSPTGTFVSIDAPSAIATVANSINRAGEIVGVFSDTATLETGHAFLRTAAGVFVNIDLPSGTSTIAFGNNDAGEIVGLFSDPNGNLHGFLRAATGAFVRIDAPGADATAVTGITNAGQIVGFARDANQHFHGFVARR